MKLFLIITVLACTTLMSLQAVNTYSVAASPVFKGELERRIKIIANQDQADRKLQFVMPEEICKPAKSAAKVIVENAVTCAMQKVMPKSTTSSKHVKRAINYAGKLGLIDKIRANKYKAVDFVTEKLLGAFGCAIERRMNFWSNLKSGFHSAVKTVGSSLKSAAKLVAKTAKKAAKMASKLTKKYGGLIKVAACKVIKEYCRPLCVKASAKISGHLKGLKISLKCMKGAFKTGCNTLCKVVCTRRRLVIRRNAMRARSSFF